MVASLPIHAHISWKRLPHGFMLCGGGRCTVHAQAGQPPKDTYIDAATSPGRPPVSTVRRRYAVVRRHALRVLGYAVSGCREAPAGPACTAAAAKMFTKTWRRRRC
jgi:hypothetical protein